MSSPETLDRRSLLLSLLLIVAMIAVCGGMAAYVLSDPFVRSAYTFAAAAIQIEAHYVSPVDWDKRLAASRRAMTDRLDRFSGYLSREEFEYLQEEQSGGYRGIGVTVAPVDEGLMIAAVNERGPAREAGIYTGDIIVAVDSLPLADLNLSEASNRLRGREGSRARLGVLRPGRKDTLEIVVERRRVPLRHVPFAGVTESGMVFVRVDDFDAGASEEVAAALDSLLAEADSSRRGLILDLRGNPGGLLAEAVETAELFLDPGEFIVGTSGRSRWNTLEHRAGRGDRSGRLPMAVLVNGSSASSAEIVAGALKQAGRAALVGDTTYGKGLVQGYFRSPRGDGLRLTISRYYLDGGLYLNEFDSALVDTGHGLVPDSITVPVSGPHFVRALESALVLEPFANLHHERLLDAVEKGRLDSSWVLGLRGWAERNDFVYESRRTQLARLLCEWTEEGRASDEAAAVAERLRARSEAQDRKMWLTEQDYILRRLAQLALEREYSVYRAYRDVVLRDDPDVAAATALLAGTD